MQNIISLETSRNSSCTSDFVTKRLCCSFVLTVAFFAIIGGFFLGRFATEKTVYKLRTENLEALKKLMTLDIYLKNMYYLNSANCPAFMSTMKCDHFFNESPEKDNISLIGLLDTLNDCFH